MMDKPATAAVEPSSRRLRPECRGHPALRVGRHAGGGAEEIARVTEVLTRPAPAISACRSRRPSAAFWAGRKAAFPAVGRITPTTTAWTAPSRGSGWRKCCRPSPDGEEIRPALCQRVPRRRRQPASADHVRRRQARRMGTGRSLRRRILELSVAPAARSPASMAGVEKINQMCVQYTTPELRPSIASRQPSTRAACSTRQGGAQPASLCRIRSHARASRRPQISRNWSVSDDARRHCQAVRAAPTAARPLRIRGAGSKDFYGGMLSGEVLAVAVIAASSPTSRPSLYHRPLRHAARRRGSRAGGRVRCWPASRRRFWPGRRLATVWRWWPVWPRRQQAGAVRDFVLGVKLVDGSGQAARFRRPGDEERRRLRRIAPDGWQPGDARRAGRGDAQGAAQTGRRAHPGLRAGRRRGIAA